jgi:SNF2 family DNA or RNA helicase
MIVIDELSSFKSSKSARFRALRTVRPRVKRVVGLTGTPAPNSLIDLWPQLYLLDQGERLGKTVTGYRDKYFFVEKQHQNIVYKYGIKPEASQTIYGLIQDICISMKSSDYLELPDIIENKILLTLSPETKKQYDDFEESQIMTFLDSGVQISTVNAAALTNKLLQFSNGAVYDDTMNYHAVHDEKLDVLESLVEEAQGQPVLVAYTYQHDLKRILKRLPQAGSTSSSTRGFTDKVKRTRSSFTGSSQKGPWTRTLSRLWTRRSQARTPSWKRSRPGFQNIKLHLHK